MTRRRLPARTIAAVRLGRYAKGASRRLGRGSGVMLGGRVTMAVDPRALARLAGGRQVVLVTGTNGKTTTTTMLASAMGLLGEVAHNDTGANMPDGHVVALAARPDAEFAVLEVDELHLGIVAEQVSPVMIVLLNLSRDQLDRVGEVRQVEARLRAVIESLPDIVVVANADDPMTVSAALPAREVVWVSARPGWRGDALLCPRCGDRLRTAAEDWWCRCGLRRPRPSWSVADGVLTGPDTVVRLGLRLPGVFNESNAALALAAAEWFGVDVPDALATIRDLTAVVGRYQVRTVDGREIRTLLAKNPAGWLEMLTMDRGDRDLVLAVNGRPADGRDLSWLWDVDFELLAGRRVIVTGERAADLAVRLVYADVGCLVEPDPLTAIRALPSGGRADVIANYTAFHRLSGQLNTVDGAGRRSAR